MKLPKLSAVKKWLPFLGGALLGAWMLGLVIASLLQSPEEHSHTNVPRGAGESETGCVVMPDGLSICDELPPDNNP